MNNKEVVQKLVPIYDEINILTEDAKQVLSEAKESGLDQTVLNRIAKAISNQKLGILEESAEDLLKLIKEVQ